jgi:hypothetical protein
MVDVDLFVHSLLFLTYINMTNNDSRTFIYLVATLLIAVAMGFLFGFKMGKKSVLKNLVTKTDTVIVRETIKEPIPTPKIKPKRKIVARLALADTSTRASELEDTCKAVKELSDSADVIVPISTSVYKTDDYSATIEGYRARLVDMTVYPQIRYITTTNTVVKHRHWTIMVGSQLGYGFTTKGVGLYSGGGISAGYAF